MRTAAALLALALAWPASAGIEDITSREAVTGLRTALDKGTRAAVDAPGRTDGFYANELVTTPATRRGSACSTRGTPISTATSRRRRWTDCS